MRVDGRLLVDPAHTLDCADVAGVMGEQETRIRALDLSVSLLLLLGRLQGLYLGFGKDFTVFSSPSAY